MTERAATVFVVDDDASYLKGVDRMLRAAGYEVRCFTSASEFLTGRPARIRGCVVADVRMPDQDGLALQEELSRSDDPLPVVFLTGHGDVPTSVKAMRGGAEDFLVKTAPAADLIAAIERALTRDAAERERRARRLEIRAGFETLTPRESEVLTHVLLGQLNKQIAAELGISERSVKRHRTSLMQKLGVVSVVELARLAGDIGWNESAGDADAR